jgi:hypothetical protein
VPEPKDARGIPVCELLTTEQLVRLGFDPATADPYVRTYSDSCGWRYADGSTAGGVILAVKPGSKNLGDVYLQRDLLARFEPMTIAGHPAARTDETDLDICVITVAIADDQVMQVEGRVSVPPETGRPCDPSIRMAELILANLPPLR